VGASVAEIVEGRGPFGVSRADEASAEPGAHGHVLVGFGGDQPDAPLLEPSDLLHVGEHSFGEGAGADRFECLLGARMVDDAVEERVPGLGHGGEGGACGPLVAHGRPAYRRASAPLTLAGSDTSCTARSAIVKATLRTRSRPRALSVPLCSASSALCIASPEGVKRRRSSGPGISALERHGVPARRLSVRSLASWTRSATTLLDSANSRSYRSSALLAGVSSSLRSMRSSSGPDRRAAYLRRTPGAQEQSTCLAAAHGHGFAARTSVNRAGNRAMPSIRLIRTSPSSSGWRRAS